MVANIITKELVDFTNYKLIKNAYNENKLEVLYFPRENMYRIEKCPNERVKTFVINEMEKFIPNCKKII